MTTPVIFQEGFDLYNGSGYVLNNGGGDWRSAVTNAASFTTGRFGGQSWNAFSFDVYSPIFAAHSALGVGFSQFISNVFAGAAWVVFVGSGTDSKTFATGNQLA